MNETPDLVLFNAKIIMVDKAFEGRRCAMPEFMIHCKKRGKTLPQGCCHIS